MRKRIVCLWVIAAMFLSFMPYVIAEEIIASGNYGKNGDPITWTLFADGTLEFEGEGEMIERAGNFYTPPWYEYGEIIKAVNIADGITTISYHAFVNCSALTEVNIPESIVSIGEMSFEGCSALESIHIPSKVTEIPYGCFNGCTNLTNINIPDGVTSIGYEAFYECKALEEITLPEGVLSIENFAFRFCDKLESIKMPQSVVSIGADAFRDCTMLKDIQLSDNISYIGEDAFLNTLFYNDETNWTDGVLYYDNYLISARNSVSGNYKIRRGTSLIAGDAFGSKYTSDGRYISCNLLESVEIPDSVKYINSEAFYNCEALKSIDMPQGIIEIGDSAFKRCSALTSITIPQSVIEIGKGAFEDCSSLISITLPDSLTRVGLSAFASTAFYKNKENWDNGALYLDNVLLKTYYDELSKSYNIKEGTYIIADGAFAALWGKSIINDISIPDSVKYIGERAFNNCSSLSDVYYNNTEEEWNEINIESGNDQLIFATIHFTGTPLPIDLVYAVSIDDAVVKVDDRYGYYRVNVNPTHSIPRNEGYKLIVAAYNGEKVTEVDWANIFSDTNSMQITIYNTDNVDSIKIFSWKNISDMRPLCEAKTIFIE